MATSLPPGNAPSGRMLALAFTAVVCSFVAASFVVQRASAQIGDLSEGIIFNSGPSIEHLAQIRRAVLEAELSLERYLHEPGNRQEAARTLEVDLTRLKDAARAYLDLPPVPGEEPLRLDIQASWLQFEQRVQKARSLADAPRNANAAAALGSDIVVARQHFLELVTRAIEHDAIYGRTLAANILETRQNTRRLATALNVVCGTVAVLMAWLLHRQARTRRALFDAHARFLRERAAELEHFAGRVAHDIRNPLSAARMAAELAIRRSDEGPVAQSIRRIIRSLQRADAITGALLEFARSGAKPDPGARTAPSEAIADTMDGFSAEAEHARIEFHIEPIPEVLVTCGSGVYLSLLGNLLRNAVKYMGDATTRRITVRVTTGRGAFVRTEVIDTGPGIAPELLPSLFEPYFRGATDGAEGLGLGLATVKRLAEGHGGRVGVTSEPGKGSTFWFELPRAGPAWELGAEDGKLAAGTPGRDVTQLQ
ncbi:sensor histidine kinase [Corallococcus sp. AB050B]|nr:sensor histidine kinase [Corallococcus sp. AB050B]